MIAFDSVRLSGFKSFVDPTTFDIQTGLTGIVGPNGCGKSNLVEALRWAMGESSAKRMRGGDMDDVIFNGTSNRTARNFAEVTIMLNNGMHTAPAPYTDFDAIEVSRRIDRDQGSTYRVNGKIARARDVQLLFADTMTGANSPALVSQGKLTQIITAKPFDRRMILEESAGITGLHARRHEAELRLQAADNNLTRLQDSLGNLENQLQSLKRQSRQAERYRVLTDEIKTLEVAIAAVDWMKLTRQRQVSEHEATTIESIVAETILAVSRLTQEVDAQFQTLPPLRDVAARAAARDQAVSIELRGLETQLAQVNAAIEDATKQITQINADMAHDEQLIDDGQKLTQTLDAEYNQIMDETRAQAGRLPVLEQTRESLAARLKDLESELHQKVQILVETNTQKNTLTQQITTEDGKINAARTRLADVTARLNALQATTTTDEAPDTRDTLTDLLADLQGEVPMIADAVQLAETEVAQTRAAWQNARDQVNKLSAEQRTIEGFLAASTDTNATPVLNDIKADAGFEQALAQALGDTLFGSTDEAASIVWQMRESQTAPTLPIGVMPMSDRVRVPAELAAALSYIGYVSDRAAGAQAAPALKPGQMIVSLDGYMWRYDGLFVKPSAKDRQAMILEQKNKLADILAQKSQMESQAENAQIAFELAEAALNESKAMLQAHQIEMRNVQGNLNTATQAFTQKMAAEQQRSTDIARAQETLHMIEQDISDRILVLDEAKVKLATFQDSAHENLDSDVATLRETVADVQTQYRDAALSVDRYTQEEQRRNARLHGIADQRIALNNRTARAGEHLGQLKDRLAQTTEKLTEMSVVPGQLEATRAELMSSASNANADKTQADEALATAEKQLTDLTRLLKTAETDLSNAKETRAGIHARMGALVERIDALSAEITAQFNQEPAQLVESAALSYAEDSELPNLDDLRAQKDKLTRSRDNIGPVNLRADVEAQEIEGTLGKVITEKADLMAAIEELRGGITKINTEARERLLAAFETINAHFKDLFVRLFGGGQAYLQLVQTDDPLGAGLEIYAQPPGKTLQSISLLSGGEQSLTAAALIFAMFLTNPSPICVLDEIDAPLDDANVERICDLLRHITEKSNTRFLVVTHHRLTMAKMDRLYGVTMAEKGVSQLVSVDLSRQLDLLEAA